MSEQLEHAGTTPKGSSRYSFAAGPAMIAFCIVWYNLHPRLWLMPDLVNGTSMATTFRALSPDDPSTPDVVGTKESPEADSDRFRFFRWAQRSAMDSKVPIPWTVGGAIADQREFDDRLRLEAQQRQQEADRAAARERARQSQIAQQAAARRRAEAAAISQRLAEDAACAADYDAIYDAYIEAPSAEGGAAVSKAAHAKNECLGRVARKWGSDTWSSPRIQPNNSGEADGR